MTFLRRVLAEPFAQFLLIGAVVAGLYALLDRSPPAAEDTVIEVGPGRIAQLQETFSRAWQRPPSPEELTGLVEAFIKEEIFYREGRKAGLDRDDTVFRRRLQQKMEFLMEPSEAEMTPSEAELQSFLQANAVGYRTPARFAFRQIFFDASKRTDVDALLSRLNANDVTVDPSDAGDTTLLPHATPLTRLDRIETDFGEEFAAGLPNADVGRWSGPVRSTFGLHLVFVEEKTEARDRQLAEVREAVLRDWQDKKRRENAEERYRQLRENYEVIVTLPGADARAQSAADQGK